LTRGGGPRITSRSGRSTSSTTRCCASRSFQSTSSRVGHWGTTPGLNLIYSHLNRVIRRRDADVVYVMGPGHGGPAAIANAWLEGTWSEVYSDVGRDEAGLHRLFRQFSFPGGVPSHVAPEVPGSFHEGGELGYSLAHAYGAAFDNPDLVVACIVGDGEAETGPLAASWHGNKFLDPATDGAVLATLQLNGYKIATPRSWPASPRARQCAVEGYGHVRTSPATSPPPSTPWPTPSTRFDDIAAIREAARTPGHGPAGLR
jgi:xylulose-5-phosphate/fructose-6-phosphate phosphoketolase